MITENILHAIPGTARKEERHYECDKNSAYGDYDER